MVVGIKAKKAAKLSTTNHFRTHIIYLESYEPF